MKNTHMNKRFLAACAAIGLAVLATVAQAGVAERVQRAKLGAVEVLVYPMDVKDVVAVQGVMPLGDAVIESRRVNPTLNNLTAMMVESGTTARDKYQIADTLAAIGAQASFNSGDTELTFSGKSLRKDMPTVVDLLAEQLRSPAFASDEFVLAKAQFGAMLQQLGDNPDALAWEGMTRAIFPLTSPNASVAREQLLTATQAATLEQVKAFHARYYGPDHMTLVFVGDIDLATATAMVEHAFSGWSGGVDFVRNTPPAPAAAARTLTVTMRDKASASVMWGQAINLRAADADYVPLKLAVNVLGSGFTGRLMSNVRDREGLTYGISASLFGADVVTGGFMMQSTFAPELLDKGIASTRRQLDLWWKQGITEEELAARKDSMVGSFQLGLGTTEGMAWALLQTRVRGESPAWLDTYPEQIRAVTLAQANAAIRRHIDSSKMVQVVAGSVTKK